MTRRIATLALTLAVLTGQHLVAAAQLHTSHEAAANGSRSGERHLHLRGGGGHGAHDHGGHNGHSHGHEHAPDGVEAEGNAIEAYGAPAHDEDAVYLGHAPAGLLLNPELTHVADSCKLVVYGGMAVVRPGALASARGSGSERSAHPAGCPLYLRALCLRL